MVQIVQIVKIFSKTYYTKAAAAHSNLVSIRKTNERIEEAFCFFKGSIEEKQQTCSDACWDFGDRRKEIDEEILA
jgi:hypothetical protein